MSKNVKFSEEGLVIWKNEIFNLLHLLYSSNSFLLLCLIIQQLYELSVWYCHSNSTPDNINLKDLKYKFKEDLDWYKFCKVLYNVRNATTHTCFKLYGFKEELLFIFTSPCFRRLLSIVFTEDEVLKFEPLLNSYALYLFTDEFESNYDFIKNHLKD